MPLTYDPIATTTLGSAQSDITFSSIPGTFTDLVLIVTGRQSGGSDVPFLRFNGTTTGYSSIRLRGNGAAVAAGRQGGSGMWLGDNSAIATQPALVTANIFSYAGSTNKSVLGSINADSNGAGFLSRAAGIWMNTAAITSLTWSAGTDTWIAGTTATLYGILRA